MQERCRRRGVDITVRADDLFPEMDLARVGQCLGKKFVRKNYCPPARLPVAIDSTDGPVSSSSSQPQCDGSRAASQVVARMRMKYRELYEALGGRLRIGPPTTPESAPQVTDVSRAIQSIKGSLRKCYHSRLVHRHIAGRLVLTVGFNRQGAVAEVDVERSGNLPDPVVGCVITTVQGVKLARAPSHNTKVTLPLTFLPHPR